MSQVQTQVNVDHSVAVASGKTNVVQRERYTTDLRHHPIDRENTRKRNVRHMADFQVGQNLAPILASALGCSGSVAASIITYAVFEVMGKEAHNDNGKALRCSGGNASAPAWMRNREMRWVYTVTRPYGYSLPAFRQTQTSEYAYGHSFAAADALLHPFGLSMLEVLDYYGNVEECERKVFDLPSIVRDMRPEMLLAVA